MIIRKKYLFYVLGITSSVIAAVVSGLDSAISYFYINNPWIFVASIFLVGSLVTFLLCLFLSIPYGKKKLGCAIDPSFSGLRFIKRNEIKYHFLAGLGNAISTIGYIYVLSLLVDPSAVLPFYQIVILYLLLLESITEKNAPTLVEVQSSIIVTFGAIMGSISLAGFNVSALLIVFFVINPGFVLLSIYQRKLKLLKINNKTNDSINIRFWNLVFTSIFSLIAVTLVNHTYIVESINVSIKYFLWIGLSMTMTFFSYVLYIRALGLGKASITQAVKASTVIFALPISMVLSLYISFDLYGTPEMLLIKIMGMTLVIVGIVSFALTTVKAFVTIQAKPGFPVQNLIKKIWDIKGVESVSATAGTYDLIAVIRTRTLLKGYERIIQKIEEIEGIKNFKWHSILKEWDVL